MSVPLGIGTAVVKAGAERESEEYQHDNLTRGLWYRVNQSAVRVHPAIEQVSIRPN